MTHAQVLETIKKEKLIAILRGIPFEKTDKVVEALLEGGVKVLEFTFDHEIENCIEENCLKIERTRSVFAHQALVGCGTLLTAKEAEAAQKAGASFAISPNTDREVIECVKKLGMVSIPGAFTPTEIVDAFRYGADIVKLFPAGDLGVKYIKSVRAPLKHIPMAAVGGVKPENLKDFLDSGVCGLGVGGQLVLSDAVKNNDYAALTARAKAFTDAIREWEENR